MSELSRLRESEGYGACHDAGHADNEFNNRCDKMAVAEWKKFKPKKEPKQEEDQAE